MIRHSAIRKEIDDIKIRVARLTSDKPHLTITDDYHITFHQSISGRPYTYIPSETGRSFHRERDLFVKSVMGPVGSGKTVMCCMDLLINACSIKRCSDGVRRSRWYIIKDTYPNIKRSVFKTWIDWFSALGFQEPSIKKSSPLEFFAKFNDGKGVVEMEVCFLGLDDNDDEKLLSTEITGAYINEARSYYTEIIFSTLQGRVGRYPAPKFFEDGECIEGKIIMDTNPPNDSSWFYELFEVKNPESHILFKQPSGLIKVEDGAYEENPKAENIRNLPKNYYVSQSHGKDEDYIKVQLMGKYGSYTSGQPVYKDFSSDFHVAENIEIEPNLDVIIGMDFGLTPAASFMQLHPSGHLKIFKEIVTFNTTLEEFLDNHMMPYCLNNLRGMTMIVSPDPSAVAKIVTVGGSCITQLESYGFTCKIPYSNLIDPRLSAVKYFLNRFISKKPSLQIDKTGCAESIKGFNGGYSMIESGGKMEPDKNKYSHIHDAIQYGCMYYHKEALEPKADFYPIRITPRRV